MIHVEFTMPAWQFVLFGLLPFAVLTFVVLVERIQHYRSKRRVRKRLSEQLANPSRQAMLP